MEITSTSVAATLSAFPFLFAVQSVPLPEPSPIVVVASVNMPKNITFDTWVIDNSLHKIKDAVNFYNQIKSDFDLSHTTMGHWLGVKRRTLYNWMNSPEKSKFYGNKIEERLMVLYALKQEMEPEHHNFLQKIAFSPIYGDPSFGEAILSGASISELVNWYDELFSNFESFRKLDEQRKFTV